MNREERLKFCGVCTKRGFSPKNGIICSLTNEVAAFETSTCPDYLEDDKEAKIENTRTENKKKDINKSINFGRYALFVIGGLYILVGFLEGFVMDQHQLLFGLIDWGVAVVFFGLAVWSYSKASLAMIIGLVFYLSIILLIGIVDPISIASGIFWKFLVVSLLVIGIRTARSEESKQKIESDEVLDQF